MKEETSRLKKKRKVIMRNNALRVQFEKRRVEKAKRKLKKDEGEVRDKNESEEPLSASQVGKQFMIEKGLYPY